MAQPLQAAPPQPSEWAPAAAPAAPRPAPAVAPAAQLAAFRVIALILAVRVLLLLALAGAFTLACMAMIWPGHDALLVLLSYGGLVMLPLVFLETRRPGA